MNLISTEDRIPENSTFKKKRDQFIIRVGYCQLSFVQVSGCELRGLSSTFRLVKFVLDFSFLILEILDSRCGMA